MKGRGIGNSREGGGRKAYNPSYGTETLCVGGFIQYH